MRKKLNAFIGFAGTILPHEIDFLIRHNQLQDPERIAILENIRENILQHPPAEKYDLSIDKRTYSHLKNWIVKQLESVDVDRVYQWLSELDVRIMNDSISPDEERKFLKFVQEYEVPGFYFTRLFEVVQNYSNFLLIRLRYKDHQTVDAWLDEHRNTYLRHNVIQEKLQQASSEAVHSYAKRNAPSTWRAWLSEVFEDSSIQGYFRHQALIRLHFIDLHAENNQELLQRYEQLGQLFSEGKFYSRRLLVNYYHNLLLLYHKNRNFTRALHYGYLSTRVATHDYLLHVNNLCDVLVQLGRFEEGLSLLRSAGKEARNTNNFYNRVGYVAFYMRCQIGVGNAASAVSYGSSFLSVYSREVMKYRWFRFFNTYLEALLREESYREVIRVCRKQKLLDLESRQMATENGTGKLALHFHLAHFLSGEMTEVQFRGHLRQLPEEAQKRLLQGDLEVLPLD